MRFNEATLRHLVTAGLSMAAWGWAAAAPVGNAAPQLEGVYPLTPGSYVAQGGNCAAPAPAALRHYDGKGIRGATTSDCRAAVREHEGNRYTVDQTCLDASAKLGRRVVQRQLIVVRDAHTFTESVGKSTTAYRYCPPEQLPPALRQPAE